MSKLPTPEIIKQVSDPKQLQDACLTLLRIVEKERDSKQKYRSSATLLKQELEAVKLELRCVEEKNETLLECLKNPQQNEENPSSNTVQISETKEIPKSNEVEILNLQKTISENHEQISQLTSSNRSLHESQIILQSKLTEMEQNYTTLQSKFNEIQKKEEILVEENDKLASKWKASEEKSNKLLEQINHIQESSNSGSAHQDQLNKLIEENSKLVEKLKTCEIAQNSFLALKEKNQNQIKELEESNLHLKEQINELSTQSTLNEITWKTAQFDHLSEFNRIQSENSVLKQQIEKLNAANFELTQKVNDSDNFIKQSQLQITQLNNDHQTLLNITENNKIKAKERIKKLKTANLVLEEAKNAEIEKLKNDYNSQLDELRKQIESENETKEKANEETKQTLSKLKTQKSNLKQKISEMKTENDELKSKISQHEVSIHDLTLQNEMMIQQLSEIRHNENETQKIQQTNFALNATIQKLNIEIIQLKEQIQNNDNLQSAVLDKESTITNLKSQIQNFIRVDKEKTDKMDKMQEEIYQLTEKIGVLSSSSSFNAVDQLALIEREKEDLQRKLDNSEATNEMKKKNQKLTEMIEKSNKLYISVKEENSFLKNQLESFKKKSLKWNLNTNIICTVEPQFINAPLTQASSSPVGLTMNNESITEGKKKRTERKLAQTAYLRRVLLQFFTEDEKNRVELINIILKLVGCTDEQVSAAVRQWERNSHLISGFFGF